MPVLLECSIMVFCFRWWTISRSPGLFRKILRNIFVHTYLNNLHIVQIGIMLIAKYNSYWQHSIPWLTFKRNLGYNKKTSRNLKKKNTNFMKSLIVSKNSLVPILINMSTCGLEIIRIICEMEFWKHWSLFL